MKYLATRRLPSGTVFLVAVAAALLSAGCANKVEPNAAAKIGARYEAPVNKTRVHEIDLVEVGKLNLKLASAYYGAGQYQTANESAAIAVEALPGDVTALGMAALIQIELHNGKKAQEYFDRAFKIAPKDADLNHNYALYLCRADGKSDPALAMSYFQAALAADGYTRPASSLSAGGDCLVKLGRDEEAIQYYTGALRFEPMNEFALFGLAELQFRRGSNREALEYVDRYARVTSPSPASLWLQIRIAKKLGLTQDEKGYSTDLRKVFPSSAQARLLDEGKFE